ncbi:MAG: CDP-alcohol phosphatidyltransferase family protein [Alphaproteobacteria bacterium]
MNLPNLISLSRLLSVPLLVWLVVSGHTAWAFWLFVLAGASDAVDGWIAKRFDMRSTLGVYLDPIADKVMLVSVYLALGFQDHLPSWLVILVVSRDMLIVGGVLLTYALSDSRPHLAPLWISKVNTVAQILLAAQVLAFVGHDIPDPGVTLFMTGLVAVTTFGSGAAYLWRWARGARQIQDGPP